MFGQLSQNQSINLKILASVMLYIGRRAAVPKFQILVYHKIEEMDNIFLYFFFFLIGFTT